MLKFNLFEDKPTEVAQRLIGLSLIKDGIGGIIIETEAYDTQNDPACVRFYNPTREKFATTHPAGTIHIHTNYGRHVMLNILSKGGGTIGFILIRALLPTSGWKTMEKRRKSEDPKRLCNGPGNLTQALEVGRSNHGASILPWLSSEPKMTPVQLRRSRRIGIRQGVDLPYRFTPTRSALHDLRAKTS